MRLVLFKQKTPLAPTFAACPALHKSIPVRSAAHQSRLANLSASLRSGPGASGEQLQGVRCADIPIKPAR
jgi:hypothetical protein